MTNNDFCEITQFIRHNYNAADGQTVALHSPTFAGNEKKYLEECIDTTFVSSVGAFVDRFESEMARYTGAAGAVVTVNGTSALHMALILSDVERGDEVITQPLTFIATCNAIAYTGASPVFIDIDRSTLGLSPDALEAWLEANADVDNNGNCRNKTTGARISAAVVMHTIGHPARLDRLVDICERWHIKLIEDAAESVGSLYHGRHTGTIAPIGALSFNGNKTITTGGGGMLLFSDETMARRAKHLTTQAKVPHRWEFIHDSIGYNYRMPNINAALGCAQLEQLPNFIADKRRTAEAYRRFFENIDGIEFVTEPEGTRSNYWLNAILLPDRTARDSFLEYTNNHGIQTRPVWELMPNLRMWESAATDGIMVSRDIADRLVNIPSGVTAPRY